MAALDDLASALFGNRRVETNSVRTDGTTHTYVGTATTDSADGSVMVELSGDVTNPEPLEIDGETYYADADTSVQLPTTQAVQEGDEVLVSVYGGTPLRSPVVTGVVGSGDRVALMASDALDAAEAVEGIAQQALDVANATGQHFWSDTDGAHVTELERADWETQQSGPNSLWNTLGMIFRDGLTNLLALLSGQTATETFTLSSTQNEYYLASPASSVLSVKNGSATVGTSYWTTGVSADGRSYVWIRDAYLDGHSGQSIEVEYRQSPSMVFYDGLGNDASHIVASFTASVIELGRNSRDAVLKFLGGTGRLRAMDNGANYILKLESDSAVGMVAGDDDGPIATVDADADAKSVYIEAADGSGGMAHVGVGFTGSTPALNVAGATESTLVFYNPTIAQVIQALKCRTNTSNAWVNADTYTGEDKRLFYTGAAVNNSASPYNGRDANLYVKTNGLNTYIPASGSQAAATPWSLVLKSGTNDLSLLGHRYLASSSRAIGTANADLSGPSITVPAGTYIINVSYIFLANGTAARDTTVGYKVGSNPSYTKTVQGNGSAVRMSHTDFYVASGSTTITAYVRSSRTTSAETCHITAIKIA